MVLTSTDCSPAAPGEPSVPLLIDEVAKYGDQILHTSRPTRACLDTLDRLMPTRDDVIEALRSVEDPELGMDIVELGLLYDVEVAEPRVHIRYSLTSMGCPAGPLIQQSIEEVVQSMPGVEQVETELTWDPPWTPDKMSEDAKFILGFG
jgi:metal-sulfur cluster biosynthetic enzyme